MQGQRHEIKVNENDRNIAPLSNEHMHLRFKQQHVGFPVCTLCVALQSYCDSLSCHHASPYARHFQHVSM